MSFNILTLKQDILRAKESGYKVVLVVTSTSGSYEPYLTPIRFIDNYCILGLVHKYSKTVATICKELESYFDFLFIDIEKKIQPFIYNGVLDSGNFYHEVLNNINNHNKLFAIRPNELTVSRIINHIDDIHLKIRDLTVGVIGLGSIGSAVARKLIDQGVNVVGKSRTYETKEMILEKHLQHNKLPGSFSTFEIVNTLETLCIKSNAIISCSSSPDIFNERNMMLLYDKILVLDVGKKNIIINENCDFEKTKNFRWLDVTQNLKKYIFDSINQRNSNLESDVNLNYNSSFVPTGIIAKPGNVLIDITWNSNKPIGRVSSNGEFIRFSFEEIMKVAHNEN